MKHEVKILPEWYEALISGLKPFEVRKDDREPKYQPNDVLLLREFDGVKYTGRTITAKIKMVLRNEYCKEGYCIMSVEVISSYPQLKQTQADRIRNISNEQLAEYIYTHDDNLNDKICKASYESCPFGDTVQPSDCRNCVKIWLESEVEDE